MATKVPVVKQPVKVAPKPATPVKKPEAPPTPEKPKKYPEVKIEVYPSGKPITVEKAKELLGWVTEGEYIARIKHVDHNVNEDEIKFGEKFFLTDNQGNKVRLSNNTINRPWSEGVTKAYMQDILRKNWMFNGETIIIGEHGRILSGQHRLIGLILAEQTRTGENKAHWEAEWPTPVTMSGIIVYGVSEDPKVTRTLDNVKPRTLADVIFADTELFGDYSVSDRKTASRMLDFAVRLLWERTGEYKETNWAPKRTHSESLGFVDRHLKLKQCIAHVFKEDGSDGKIAKYLYPGHAAALMYLFACSGTADKDVEDYCVTVPTTEKHLKFDRLKKAGAFFSDLVKDESPLKELRVCRKPLPGDGVEEGGGFSGFTFATTEPNGTFDERVGVLIRAWNNYVKDEPVPPIELTYDTQEIKDPEGAVLTFFNLKEFPTVAGGIDIGKMPKKVKKVKEPKEGEVGTGSEQPVGETEEGFSLEGEGEEGDTATETAPQATGSKVDPSEVRKAWDSDKKDYAGNVLMYKTAQDNYIAYFDDAELVATMVGVTPRQHPVTGATRVVIAEAELASDVTKLNENGHTVIVIDDTNKEKGRQVHYVGKEPEGDSGEENAAVESGEPEPTPEPVKEPEPVVKEVPKEESKTQPKRKVLRKL